MTWTRDRKVCLICVVCIMSLIGLKFVFAYSIKGLKFDIKNGSCVIKGLMFTVTNGINRLSIHASLTFLCFNNNRT